MKNTLLFLTLISAFINAQVSTFPWTETFEDTSPTQPQWVCEYIGGTNSSVPSGLFWSIKSTTSVGYYSSTGAYAGSKMAVFDTRSHTRDAVARFVSPVMNLSGVTSPKVDFYYRNMIWGSDQNILNIYYRTSSSGTWTLITSFNSNINTWTNSGAINLPNPSATYQIALEGVAHYGYGLDVDDLKVSSAILGTSEANRQKNTFKVYPNPASDFITISSEKRISEISLFDLSGKQLNRIKTDKTEANIPVSHLPKGTYIVQINSEGILNSQKFIKK